MRAGPWLRRIFEPIMRIGEVPGEPETKRGGRRVFLVAFVIATLLTIPQVVADLAAGYTAVGRVNLVLLVLPIVVLLAMWRWPARFDLLLGVMFALITAGQLIETALFGGLFGSGLVVIFGLAIALAALLASGLRAALLWFGVFIASVIFAVVTPSAWQRYTQPDPAADAAFNLIATAVVVLAIVGYFVAQRDRFQQRSDDLLHNILPIEIAARLKESHATIADDVPSASVLFADVVDFTPMSSAMTPAALVTLLDEVFSAFDAFVDDLGLEKIKTVGDAYMVASGVPVPREDHAVAIADLAIRIRDHVATTRFDGRHLRIRIGIASGPVTAGIIGTHKFAYDLWGDTVNTASRMESSGVSGEIQIAPTTYELLGDRYRCEPRGPVQIKGKDEMFTFLLLGRREREPGDPEA
jgi:adenylate cyclase